MSDTDKPDAKSEDKPEDKPDTPDTADKDTQAEADKWKAMARKWEREAKANTEKLQKIEDAGKSETDKLRDEAEAAKRDAAAARKEALKLKVGLDKNLPKSLVSRLQGDTEEEMSADADALLAELKPGSPSGDADGGKRGGTPDQKKDLNSLLRIASGH